MEIIEDFCRIGIPIRASGNNFIIADIDIQVLLNRQKEPVTDVEVMPAIVGLQGTRITIADKIYSVWQMEKNADGSNNPGEW